MNLSVYSIIYIIIRIKIFEYKNKYPGMIISVDIPENIPEDGNLEEIIEKYKLYIDKCNKILKKIHFMEIDYNNAYNNTTELLYFLNIIYRNKYRDKVYHFGSLLHERTNYYMDIYNNYNSELISDNKYKINIKEYEEYNKKINEKIKELDDEIVDLTASDSSKMEIIKDYNKLMYILK